MTPFSDAIPLISAILDRGEWKHTWHLPRDSNGYITWHSPETLKKVASLLKQARDTGIALAYNASKQLVVVETELQAVTSECL